MARPRKQVEPEMAQPATEREPAPVQYTPPPPRVMRVERQGSETSPVTRRFPQIRAGICEYCGVLDKNVAAQFQYKLCPHYRGMQARCTYCPESKDPDDVVYHSILNVAEHPEKAGTLVMWCGSFQCSEAHLRRFRHAVS